MKKSILSAAVVALSLGAMEQAVAAPMNPAARPPPGNWGPIVVDNFTLLADTDNLKLVYYIPRKGGVAVQSPLSTSPIPRFSIYAQYPTSGFFAGQELTQMGGTLSTTSNYSALQTLTSEAAAQGLQVTPAPVTKAKTSFSVLSEQTSDGRAPVECEWESYTGTGPNGPFTIRVPKCFTYKDGVRVDANVMYKFTNTTLASNGTAAQDVAFQATTMPDYAGDFRYLMTNAVDWDATLFANVEWEVKTANITRQAKITVNWQSVFEQASAFAAYHNNACIDIEVSSFFQRMATCQGGVEPCGIKIEYNNNGVWTTTMPHDSNFLAVVNALQKTLQDELFASIRPVNGPVSTSTSAVFTLRANYEKIFSNRNEQYLVNYNAGPAPFGASTVLNITCLYGGFEAGRVYWNMNDPGCRAMLGQ
jgi:hypothetical protein